ANGNMTSDQLRQICVDFMRLQLSFEWTPDRDHDFNIETEMHNNKPMRFEKGTLYAGIPYRAGNHCGSSGNPYTVMELYDPETGVLSSEGKTTDQWTALITNHCSSSCYWAWSRVVNTMFGSSDDFTRQGWSNARMVQKEGFLTVGPYTYTGVSRWDEGDGTRAVCEANGEQVMFRSYAAMLPGDGLIQLYPKGNTNANHVQMLATKPEVTYLPDGSIDGENSFLTILEQTSTPKETKREDGETVWVEGGIDKCIPFQNMFKASYIPFTFAEFHGENPVEPLEFHLTHKNGDEVNSLSALRDSTLTANYPISSVKIRATDSGGKETYLRYAHPDKIGSFFYEMYLAVSQTPLTHEKKGDRVEISVQFGNGEAAVLYQSK
ncbi:MAG: hypothetical protein IJC26_01100, partial [Clostridia bacterium]|nr:hypothetical protein [Clostridia bacterium]